MFTATVSGAMFRPRRGLYTSLLVFFVTAFATNSRAGLILDGNDAVHISMGADRDYVGSFYRGPTANALSFAGSITLIDDGAWGLTAKHQVLQNFNDPSSLFASFGAKFTDNVNDTPFFFEAKAVFANPNQDLALIYFGSPVASINPVQRFRGNVTVGMEGYNAGFGVREFVNDTNPPVFTGDRRAGFDVIERVSGDVFRTDIDFSFSSNFRPFEMGGRNGDSGGGFILESMIDTDNDGVPDTLNRELLGIMAAASAFNITGASTFYQIQDNNWIDVTKSSVTSVPEPSSLLTLGTLLLGGASRRLFKRKRMSYGVHKSESES